METPEKKAQTEEKRKRIFKTVLKISVELCGCVLLVKYRKHIENKLLTLLLKDQQSPSLLIKQAQQLPKDLPDIIPEKAMTEAVASLQSTLPVNLDKPILNGGQPFLVRGGIRNLPPTWNASPEKRRIAEMRGISLSEHQTLVDNFFKNNYCA